MIAKYGGEAIMKGMFKMGLDASTIKKMTGGFSNTDVRKWYSSQVKNIDVNISPTEANARSIVNQRNNLKKQARELMSDTKAAADLEKTDPIQDFDYYFKKYSDQGYEGEDLYKRIMQGGTTPNPNVNKKLGVE